MMAKETAIGGHERTFQATLWTVVRKAREHSREALEQLIGIYWKPAYSYVRAWGASVEDAKDLTQGFFALLLEKDYLKDVSKEKGRFRNFLLASLRHYLLNEAKYAQRKKRSGGRNALPLDFDIAEKHYLQDPGKGASLDGYFRRQWALTVLERALETLGRELPPDRYEAVRQHLSPGDVPSYEETARKLGRPVSDVKALLYRARKRYRDLIRAEIRSSVDSDGDVESEIRELFRAL